MTAKTVTLSTSDGATSTSVPLDRFLSYDERLLDIGGQSIAAELLWANTLLGRTFSAAGRSGRHDLTPPSAEAFAGPDGGTMDFLPAPVLNQRVMQLIGEYEELSHLGSVELRCLWKATGGKSGGKNVLGKCQKLSGLARFLSVEDGVPVDFVIWLAADHLAGYDERAIEAVLYHECSHIGWDEEGDKPVVVAHEFAGFLGELERYGLYALDLQNLGQTMRQLRLGETGGAA